MSGGMFPMVDFYLRESADKLENEIKVLSVAIPEVKAKLLHTIKLLRECSVYLHRADWLLSGDDGEKTYLERLNRDLEQLEE